MINSIVEFSTDQTNNRILFLTGVPGIDSSQVARFAIDYASIRGHLPDGAYHIQCKGISQKADLESAIAKRLDLRWEVKETFSQKKALLLLDEV